MSGNSVTTIRLMTVADIPAGIKLREAAGWNQTEQDWQRFLRLDPAGNFVACRDDRVCGTVTTLNYEGRFGWIGMVLVDPAYRRQGIGTRLLEKGIDFLESAKVESIKLDATPDGRPLYLQRRFVDEYGIQRWEGVSKIGRGVGLTPMKREELRKVCEWDRRIFGADRTRLLTALWQEGPQYSVVICEGGEVAGYVLGRAGARAHYLGPWVASPLSGVADELLREFLSRLDGQRVYVDVCLKNPYAVASVQAAGFHMQRSLTRMCRGPNNYPGQPQLVYGIGGPELG